jgi:hypothetical protein
MRRHRSKSVEVNSRSAHTVTVLLLSVLGAVFLPILLIIGIAALRKKLLRGVRR